MQEPCVIDAGGRLAQATEQRERLMGEKQALLRENYPLLLDTLSVADGLAERVGELRATITKLTEQIFPQLEELTSFEHVESFIVRPHRERTERLRQNIKAEQAQRQRLLVERSVELLKSNVPLSTCLRLVSTLKQQREFIENPGRLEQTFLEARTKYLVAFIEENIINKKAGMDNIKLFEAIVKIMREPVLDIVTQYKAVFSNLYPLSRFVVVRIEWFLASTEALIKSAKNTLVLASFWNQLILLNSSFVNIGAGFLSLIEPVFIHQATQLINSSATSSWQYFQNKATEITSIRKSPTSSTARIPVSAGKDILPPMEISEFPWLLLMVNCFVDIFEQIRVFAIPPMQKPVNGLIERQLALFSSYFDNRCQHESQETLLEFRNCLDNSARPFIETTLESYFTHH